MDSKSPVRYYNGAVILPQVDLEVPGGGFFGHKRYYCNQASFPYDGPNGYDWFVETMPYAVTSGTSIAIVIDPNNPYWFGLISGSYVARYGVLDVKLSSAGGVLTFTDNSGGKTRTVVFNSLAAGVAPGGFVSYTDENGFTIAVYSRSGSLITETRRAIPGTTVTDSLVYAYVGSGASAKIQTVTWSRQTTVSGASTPMQRALSAYWTGGSGQPGNLNDLQSVSQQLPDGSGGWNTVAVDFYWYYITGFVHGLQYHFGPEAYRLMLNAGINPATASASAVQPYADHYFQYNSVTGRVVSEVAAVCPGCPGGGTTSDLFAYAGNSSTIGTTDPTLWVTRTTQTLPDNSQIIVYTNYCGQVILIVPIDATGANKWPTFFRRNAAGMVTMKANPSAVSGYSESYNDLVNFSGGASSLLYQHAGLIEVTDYYTSTSGGGVLNYPMDRQVQQGQAGTPVLIEAYAYASNTDSNANTVYAPSSLTRYPMAGSTTPSIVTGYAYTYASGTNQLTQKVTTPPVVGTGQNGDGTTLTITENYDAYGNRTSVTDERGIVNQYVFDVTMGVMTEQVLNYQSGVTQPGVNVTSDMLYDSQGRLTQTLGPSHTVVLSGTATTIRPVTWNVYVQSILPVSGTWDVDQTWTGQGYATGSGPTYVLIDPVTINKTDKDGRSTDAITSHRSTGSGALSPTDTFVQTDWQSWASTQYDQQHRTISSRKYFLIPSSGLGTAGTNYAETDLGYDALERQNRVAAPGGTITRTVWTAPQRVASTWVGTNDTGATDSNPAGSGSPNNMVQVTANQYDGGSAGGDGNLTQQTQYASATDTRVTNFGFDFRDRQTSITDALNGYIVNTLDNLDRLTQVQQYASPTGNLIGQSGTNYDDRGRAYQDLVYAVDPSTGTVGNVLTGNSWYDHSGNLLQRIAPGDAQAFTKSTYNGVNWVTGTYRGYNTTGTSWSQANTVANDVIMEQSIPSYDEVGNVVSAATFQRLNDAPFTGPGSTGPLSYGTQPEARVSYAAGWFDGIDRQIASANYGAIASFTRPTTPPASSATVLVDQTAYNQAGQGYQTTDPAGIVNQSTFDNAGRRTQLVEAYGSTTPRTTQWTFTLDDLTASMTAVNSTTGNQTTTWAFGTTSTSGVFRNDLLASVTYPDSVSGSDVVSYTYNRLGQQATITDQRGTVRTLTRDKLGRVTDDGVTTVGAGTDNAVLRISTAYEVRGMIASVTSYDNATPGSGTVLNQCALSYNGFRQLIEEQQEHSGAVTGSSANVQYGYASGTGTTNYIRPTSVTYPNGRVISYIYAAGRDTNLNRVTTIQDPSAVLARYTYLGLGTIVRIAYPQPLVWLDLWGGTSGVFSGLDLFNRIIDQRWQNNTASTPTDIDRYQYGYDQASNRLWKANLMTTGLDEFYAYDPLNRLTLMQRGTLNTGKTGITGTPVREMDWTLDPTGNWPAYLTKTSGTTDLNQTRTSNTVNEITAIGGTPTWVTPAYDPAGNTTTMPQPATPTSSYVAVYDAWNRMVKISAGGSTVATYTFDGRNRRIVKVTISPSETRHFYFTDSWRDVEERVGTSTSMDKQYVWGIRYIDELVCRDDTTPQRVYATHDANFNLTGVCNVSGSIQERFLYDPYGVSTVLTAAWGATTDAFSWAVRFTGRHYDFETQLYSYRRRFYHTQVGRLTTRDPLPQVRGGSLYEYVYGQPTQSSDPSGLLGIPDPVRTPVLKTVGEEVLGGLCDVIEAPFLAVVWLVGPGAGSCNGPDVPLPDPPPVSPQPATTATVCKEPPGLPPPPPPPAGPCEFYLAWCEVGNTDPFYRGRPGWNNNAPCSACYVNCKLTGMWDWDRCPLAGGPENRRGPRWPNPKDRWEPAFPG